MTYDQTVSYLYGLQGVGIKLGLDNISSLLSAAGNPHKSFRSIHVGGTNGKGSACAVIASVLQAAGHKVGLFTSPHLIDFTERIRVNNKMISQADVIRLACRFRSIAETAKIKIQPTFFEINTAMAFEYFKEQDVEWAVVEVGLGGRLDSTNVISPEVSVITNVSRDHESFLGDSIEEIAFEKAGIIKPGVPVVTAAKRIALKIIGSRATEQDAPIFVLGKDFSVENIEPISDGLKLDFTGVKRRFSGLLSNLVGRHQADNIGIALAACEQAEGAEKAEGMQFDYESVKKGLFLKNWPGRMEKVSDNPLIILDSAHNGAAAEALAVALRERFADRPITMILGIMKDKQTDAVMAPLAGVASHLIVTAPSYERAAAPVDLMPSARKYCSGRAEEAPNLREAISKARRLCASGDSVMVIAGSFYTTGEAKEILGSEVENQNAGFKVKV